MLISSHVFIVTPHYRATQTKGKRWLGIMIRDQGIRR